VGFWNIIPKVMVTKYYNFIICFFHHWKEIRAPGTAIPGLTKAGTYYTSRGKEYWMLKKKDSPIRIELDNNNFKRLILGVSGHEKRASIIRNLRERGSYNK
jgi:hypothetical protein